MKRSTPINDHTHTHTNQNHNFTPGQTICNCPSMHPFCLLQSCTHTNHSCTPSTPMLHCRSSADSALNLTCPFIISTTPKRFTPHTTYLTCTLTALLLKHRMSLQCCLVLLCRVFSSSLLSALILTQLHSHATQSCTLSTHEAHELHCSDCSSHLFICPQGPQVTSSVRFHICYSTRFTHHTTYLTCTLTALPQTLLRHL
jgi:hypothetical protein